MHIGIDIRHLGRSKPSGVGQYTLEVIRALSKLDSDHTFELLSSGRKCLDLAPFSLPNVPHTHVSIPNRILNLKLRANQGRLSQYFKTPPDVLFLPNMNFVGREHTPYVVTVHDLSFELFTRTFPKKMQLWHKAIRPKQLLENAAAVIVPSKSAASDIRALYGIDAQVIAHGIDHARFSPKPSPRHASVKERHNLPDRYFLFLGTLEPRKNIAGILKAFEQLPPLSEGGPGGVGETHLVLAGSDRINLPVLIRKHAPKSAKRIKHLGYVADADRPSLYLQSIATLFPSLYEGFGMPILESLRAGAPVITAHNSAMLEHATPAVIHVDPYNTHDITEAMKTLLKPEVRNNCSDKGLAYASEYSWEKCARSLLQAMESKTL